MVRAQSRKYIFLKKIADEILNKVIRDDQRADHVIRTSRQFENKNMNACHEMKIMPQLFPSIHLILCNALLPYGQLSMMDNCLTQTVEKTRKILHL